jgi:hypothetical protein
MKADLQADKILEQGASMHERKQLTKSIAWIAVGLMSIGMTNGCTNYGGSVPIDDDAGMMNEGGSGSRPPGSVDASVPIDDDAGLVKEKPPVN